MRPELPLPNPTKKLELTMGTNGTHREARPGAVDTGPVPHDQADGYAFPTWRSALADAARGVETAYDRRRRVFQAAYDAGLTLGQIAEAVGLTAAGVHKIIGRQRSASLDSPAFQNERTK